MPPAGMGNSCNLWNILCQEKVESYSVIPKCSSTGNASNLWNILCEEKAEGDLPIPKCGLNEMEGLPSELAFGTVSHSPESDRISRMIIRILHSYSPASRDPSQMPTQHYAFENSIKLLVQKKKPIHIILPAFPFKSPNRVDKVLGALPDMGEEIALARLDGLCAQINQVYPGTSLTILSDGLIYNDILGVTDEDVWNYGSELRRLAKEKFQHISFTRLSRLAPTGSEEPPTLPEYLSRASWYREMVIQHLPEDFDIGVELTKIDSLMTYRGYLKFLLTDLKYKASYEGLSKSKVKGMNEEVAKKMIKRGAAFALALQKAFPESVRISIHRSKSEHKLPIALFSEESYTTPWHCTSALELDGSWKHAHNEIFKNNSSYELVYRNDRPSFYRRRSELYEMTGCEVSPNYPCGLVISPSAIDESISIEMIDMSKARRLAEFNSPVIFRGFQNTTDIDLFTLKAREMGPIMPWKFGEVLVVRDAGTENGGLNNVLSAEPMPMHFDGLFKTVAVKDEDGIERLVPQPPRFQFFTVVTPSPKNCGLTLLASSRLIFSLLSQDFSMSRLEGLTWTVSTTAFKNSTISKLQLVVPHPKLGTPCIRYHEPWPATRTKFDPTDVSIEGLDAAGSIKLTNCINFLLYDRRVCYYHEWIKGDLVLSDNINMMHTRTGFTPGSPRELWRIHID